jgi:signal transduction histidine kinase
MDGDGQLEQREAVAAATILERGIVGFVWLTDDLVVRARSGTLTDWIDVDAPYAMALPMLVGYEEKLAELRRDPNQSAIFPNVGLLTGATPSPKVDMQVFWVAQSSEYLLVMQHESTQSALQLELHQEIASRQLAESREVELARAIKRTNGELSRANRDLEEFAYVISHDLRAPLRAMRITADMLEMELQGQIGAEAMESLGRIRILSRRMGSMMSGLLEYARVGRKHEAVTQVDTARLVSDILVGIGAPGSLKITRHGSWPVLTTLAEPLDVVLRNLVENAVKHHDTKVGVIALSAHDDGGFVRFEVADDGPGIDPSYHQAIFESFRTVAEEVPPESSGIGLALVKKTAEGVGGRIEIRSDPARHRGTTFLLYWPRAIATI